MNSVTYSQDLALQAVPKTNFRYAFFFLSPVRRRALTDVYGYCRLIDDIVDGPGEVAAKAAELGFWRRELKEAFFDGQPTHPIAQRLKDAERRFGLRYEDALAVLLGCEMDLRKTRYATWAETYDYCYHVASSVGLLCTALFGCRDPRSRDYAIHLGRALQLTNILRDIAEDAARDRLYLPAEALREFGLEEADLFNGVPMQKRDRVARLLFSVAQRAREEYRLARAKKSPVDRIALLPAEIMGKVYFELLVEIEQRGLEILRPQGRVSLSRRRKLGATLYAVAGSLLSF